MKIIITESQFNILIQEQDWIEEIIQLGTGKIYKILEWLLKKVKSGEFDRDKVLRILDFLKTFGTFEVPDWVQKQEIEVIEKYLQLYEDHGPIIVEELDKILRGKADSRTYELLSSFSTEDIKRITQLFSARKKLNAPTIWPIPTTQMGVEKIANSCYGPRFGRRHTGVDLKTKAYVDEQPLWAACAGRVVKVSKGEGACGAFIKIKCNNGDAVGYCHLNMINENLEGLLIPKYFPIGVSGGGSDEDYDMKGNSMGAHLHYMTWKGSKKVNPTTFLGAIKSSSSTNAIDGYCDSSIQF